ncbi:MAG: DUF5320 family protein [Pseudomonadota bacterium]
MPGFDRTGPLGGGPMTGGGFGRCNPASRGRNFSGNLAGRGAGRGLAPWGGGRGRARGGGRGRGGGCGWGWRAWGEIDSPPTQGWELPSEPQPTDAPTDWQQQLKKLESELNSIKKKLEELCTRQ